MFIDPEGRAIEYMGQLDETQVSVRATDATRQWTRGTVLTPASLFDLGGAAGLNTFPVRNLGQLLRTLYMVNGDKAVMRGSAK